MAKKTSDKYARVTGNGMRYLNTWDEKTMTNKKAAIINLKPKIKD